MERLLLITNVIMFGWAALASIRKIRRDNVRMWLRIPAAFVAIYICFVYLLASLGIVPQDEIRFFMRWFQLVIAAYIILEAQHG